MSTFGCYLVIVLAFLLVYRENLRALKEEGKDSDIVP